MLGTKLPYSGLFWWCANIVIFVVDQRDMKFSTHEFYNWSRALYNTERSSENETIIIYMTSCKNRL